MSDYIIHNRQHMPRDVERIYLSCGEVVMPMRPFPEPEEPREAVINPNYRLIQICPFWINSPELWFLKLENEFKMYHIDEDQDYERFDVVIRYLDEETMTMVESMIQYPPREDRYDSIKNLLIQYCNATKEERIRKLLRNVKLGVKLPSILYEEMEHMAGCNVKDEILVPIWLERLPFGVSKILQQITHYNISSLKEYADVIMRENLVSLNKVGKIPASFLLETDTQRLTRKIEELITRLETNELPECENRMSYSPCFYHWEYGQKARKCIAPCSVSSSKPNITRNT